MLNQLQSFSKAKTCLSYSLTLHIPLPDTNPYKFWGWLRNHHLLQEVQKPDHLQVLPFPFGTKLGESSSVTTLTNWDTLCAAVLTGLSETDAYIPASNFYFNLLLVSHEDSPVVLNTMMPQNKKGTKLNCVFKCVLGWFPELFQFILFQWSKGRLNYHWLSLVFLFKTILWFLHATINSGPLKWQP